MEAVRRHKQILSLVSLVIAGDSGTIWGKSPKKGTAAKKKIGKVEQENYFLRINFNRGRRCLE